MSTQVTRTHRSCRRLLLVDDDPFVLRAMGRVLGKLFDDCEVVLVKSGHAALEELALGRYDVVVTDLNMPGMDGYALLRRIQAAFPTVARVAVSADVGSEAAASDGAVQVYLGKPLGSNDPFGVEQLRAILERTDAKPPGSPSVADPVQSSR